MILVLRKQEYIYICAIATLGLCMKFKTLWLSGVWEKEKLNTTTMTILIFYYFSIIL